MEKEFVPYEEAIVLKELEFDEPCLSFYYDKTKFLKLDCNPEHLICKNKASFIFGNENYDVTLAPTYQQAFRWFREKHKLHGFIENTCVQDGDTYHAYINSTNVGIIGLKSKRLFNMFDFKTYEEAQIGCIKKLIEIVKNK